MSNWFLVTDGNSWLWIRPENKEQCFAINELNNKLPLGVIDYKSIKDFLIVGELFVKEAEQAEQIYNNSK